MVLWGGRKETEQVVVVLLFTILALIILSLRLYTRFIVTRCHGPEDWFITVAFVCLADSINLIETRC